MSNPLDTKIIGRLAEILDKNNLTGIEYEDEFCRINLKREINNAVISTAPIIAPTPTAINTAPTATTASSETASAPADEDYSKNPGSVKSPMVGVVYLSSDPNSPNYVKVGDTIAEGDTVCLIEAMKTYNQVKAHKSGRVSKILVESGDPVEYGEPLVVIE